MGACKACGEIFGSHELKNGLCEKCIAEGYVMRKPKKKNLNMTSCRVCGKEISKTAKQCPHCGEEYVSPKEQNRLTKEYIKSSSKSRLVSFLLIIVFSVFGLFYASIRAGILLIIFDAVILNILLPQAQASTGEISTSLALQVLFLLYILPILWGDRIIVKRKLLAEAKLLGSK